jgi:ABC-type phosphate/phosphonate transport system substrate-binding protein
MGRSLRFVTALAENTIPICVELARRVEETTALKVEFRPAEPWAERKAAIEAQEVDILWMCGLATVEALDAGRLDAGIVAAPVFPGRSGATYRSVIVTRHEPGRAPSLGAARIAVNERSSWSGFHAWRLHVGAARPASVLETGSHADSIAALLHGRADLAAIDETLWDWLQNQDEAVARLRVVDRTQVWPAPPFSLARRLAPATRQALQGALLDAAPTGLERIVPAGDSDYDAIRDGHSRSEALAVW